MLQLLVPATAAAGAAVHLFGAANVDVDAAAVHLHVAAAAVAAQGDGCYKVLLEREVKSVLVAAVDRILPQLKKHAAGSARAWLQDSV